jgi:membrane associated rhomboid family serine protease
LTTNKAWRLPYIGIATIVVAVEAGIHAAGLANAEPDRVRGALMYLLGFWPGLLADWQPNFPLQSISMFATYWLVHAGPIHLLGNVAVIAWAAHRIGPVLQPLQTLEIWSGAVLGGAIAYGLAAQPYAPMIGASGGVFGLLGAVVLIEHESTRQTRGVRKAAFRTAMICSAIIALTILDYAIRNTLLAWQAHLGGFIAGASLAAAIKPKN